MTPGLMLLPFLLAAGPGTGATPPAVSVRIDAAAGRLPISPYLYGKNGNLAGTDAHLWNHDARLGPAAGLRLSRETDGNNGTKYNWRNDLSSHPDWYNNVYPQGRERRARAIQDRFPGIDGLFGFPVLGWVAKTAAANCDENRLDPGNKNPHANLCGGGVATAYLESVTPAQTVDVLDHWFGPGGLQLDPKRFRLWHLDNEPECWASTHDDVCTTSFSAEACVRRYVAVAKEVKSRYPGVRLMAPGFASEWYWWNWTDHACVHGKPWMQYFIERMAEESRAFGRPLIDLVDIHTYIDEPDDTGVLMEHRNWFDPDYASPSANGCKRIPDCGWHEDQKVERVLGRIREWIDASFGPGNAVGIGTTESGAGSKDPMVQALWYASQLGTFADHGVEVFTPWYWHEPMWEVLHLFSRYAGAVRIAASCNGEPWVSCYASQAADAGSLTLIFVNRNAAAVPDVATTLASFAARPGPARTLTLAGLPKDTLTFVSHTKNALHTGSVRIADHAFTVSLPARSIVAVLVPAAR